MNWRVPHQQQSARRFVKDRRAVFVGTEVDPIASDASPPLREVVLWLAATAGEFPHGENDPDKLSEPLAKFFRNTDGFDWK